MTHRKGVSVAPRKCPAGCPAWCRRSSWMMPGDFGDGAHLNPTLRPCPAGMLLSHGPAIDRSSVQPRPGHSSGFMRFTCASLQYSLFIHYRRISYRTCCCCTSHFYDDKQCIILQRPETGSPPPIFNNPACIGPWAIFLWSLRGEPGRPPGNHDIGGALRGDELHRTVSKVQALLPYGAHACSYIKATFKSDYSSSPIFDKTSC
jgi:hypothetical protein